ncbi:MAG: RagB/SusD family nutrient uptake outer membrane protein [Cyclonatronaceae bacterium]
MLLALLLVSCDGILDTDPQQSIGEDEALNTPGNVQAALVGAYSQHRAVTQYGGDYQFLTDLLASDTDLEWSGTFFQPREVFDKDIATDNSYTQGVWSGSYNTINRANNVLSALDILNESEAQRVEAEARFLRGAAFFELVRVFGKAYNDGDPASNPGVPLPLEPTRGIDEGSQLARSSVEEVYTQVIADLSFARDNLPASNGAFADTYAASALLSRVFLMQADYPAAAEEANTVIESGNYSLMPSFEEVFNNDSAPAEFVYATVNTTQDNANDLNLFYASSDFDGRGDIDILDAHLERYEAGDERADFFYDGGGARRTSKWQNLQADIPVVRLAELHLTRAEANFRTGSSLGAAPLEDINALRARVGLDALDDLTLDDILNERRLELSFEGHLLYDLKRTEQNITEELPFDADALVYPIPQREMEVNPNLVQNPGYGS